nr:MAG TPA: hypothetical protein [Caudoviricetes sp.]
MVYFFYFLCCWLFSIPSCLYAYSLCVAFCYLDRGSCLYCCFKISQLNYTFFCVILFLLYGS